MTKRTLGNLMSISEFEGLSEEEIRQYIAVGCKNLGNSTAAANMRGSFRFLRN